MVSSSVKSAFWEQYSPFVRTRANFPALLHNSATAELPEVDAQHVRMALLDGCRSPHYPRRVLPPEAVVLRHFVDASRQNLELLPLRAFCAGWLLLSYYDRPDEHPNAAADRSDMLAAFIRGAIALGFEACTVSTEVVSELSRVARPEVPRSVLGLAGVILKLCALHHEIDHIRNSTERDRCDAMAVLGTAPENWLLGLDGTRATEGEWPLLLDAALSPTDGALQDIRAFLIQCREPLH